MTAEEVDAYLAGLDEPRRSTLEALRRSILAVVPDAEQGLSYGVPAFRVDGKVVAGFAAQKGSLSFPIAGRTTIRPARRPSSDGPGLELRAAPGSAVRCVFQGRVAFADTYPEYGKTVIVDHGRRHYTLSSNLGAIDVKVGDEVATGERLGAIGSEPGAALYFEIRVNKSTVDPNSWFGI